MRRRRVMIVWALPSSWKKAQFLAGAATRCNLDPGVLMTVVGGPGGPTPPPTSDPPRARAPGSGQPARMGSGHGGSPSPHGVQEGVHSASAMAIQPLERQAERS